MRASKWACLFSSRATSPVARNIASAVRAPGFNASGLTDGIVNTQNSRSGFVNEAGQALSRLAIIHSGWYTTSVSETDAPNAYALTAAIEYPANTFTQVTWGGYASTTVSPGANVVSDLKTLAVAIPAGAIFWVRAFIAVTTGQKWPTSKGVWPAPEQMLVGTNQSDLTLGGTISGFGTGLRPSAVIAPVSTGLSLAILGDSIPTGSIGDNFDAHGNVGGYAKAASGVCGVIDAAVSGAALAGQTFTRRLDLFRKAGVTHVLNELGVNDLIAGNSAATLEANMLNLWQAIRDAGMKPVQITITPRTTSTDSWQTTTNQTVSSGGFTGGATSVRAVVNANTRSLPAPLYDYVEIANAVETAPTSGLWIAGAAYSSRLGAVDSWVVGSGSTTTSVTSNATQAANYYASPGALVFTSGALSGTRVVVTANTSSGTFTVPALAQAPTAGDAFLAYSSTVPCTADGLHPNATNAALSLGGHFILRDQTLGKLTAWLLGTP